MLPAASPLLLVLISSLAWVALDLVRKLLAGRMPAVPLLVLLAGLPVPLFAAWWLWEGAAAPQAEYFLPGLISVALNVVANFWFLRAFAIAPLSVTIPLLALTPVFATVLAIPLLQEWPSPLQVFGIALVVGGAFALNLRGGDGARPADIWRAFRRQRGSMMMAGVALLWSVTPALDKLAMSHASPALHAVVLNAGVALAAGVWLVAAGRASELRAASGLGLLLAAAVTAAVIGLATQLVAMQHVHVGLIETIKRGIGFAGAILVGKLLFRERVGVPQVAAVAMMTAGVAAILL